MSRPWLKWYPRDWRADPCLRMCSLAARGLWADLLGYMHEATPYGHLLIDGKAPDLAGIASLVGRPIKEVRKAFAELESNGVFSREGRAILSRRMVRDNERAEEGREHIGRRWANGQPDSSPIRDPIRSPDSPPTVPPITQKPETESERKQDAPDGAPSVSKKYAFESGAIRLNQRDFDSWKTAFSHLDVPAELIGLTKWAGEQGQNWFFAVSGALAKRNREVAAKPKPSEYRTMSGMEGII